MTGLEQLKNIAGFTVHEEVFPDELSRETSILSYFTQFAPALFDLRMANFDLAMANIGLMGAVSQAAYGSKAYRNNARRFLAKIDYLISTTIPTALAELPDSGVVKNPVFADDFSLNQYVERQANIATESAKQAGGIAT